MTFEYEHNKFIKYLRQDNNERRGYLMIRLFSMDMKREVRSYIFWIGWLVDLLMFSQDRKWMVMGGGKEREREHAVSNADTNDAYFNKTIDLLLVGKKEKGREKKDE